ncbi:hypothetical protein HN51_050004 [Arachis hypogaea]|uniref:Flocculation protein n=1 Tax=Arachis hypogaea TaxID=3818 RepID=A0A444YD71_ARAHY|nr:uncharacterized protein LOC112765110 [Arachis hypogaea]QHN91642.1 uncharacterized protein DS421_17g576660 [Arachis hypogaea]RYQ99856.1 hypothetical protein Ahy_B07g087866 isoform C [Arachis hypogaea]
MSNRRGRDSLNGGLDPSSNGDDFDDSSSVNSGSNSSQSFSEENGGSRSDSGLTERLAEILVEEGDGDLLIQQSNREDRLLQWLQALDMQVMGACRADERMKPLLKMNAACGVAEDHLLTQLSQHFEPSEVGMLARCFCVPLVSVRVGKINKEGTRLCPTAIRGNLTLVLLPSSDLRLSFIGDDGKVERIFTFSNELHCSAVLVDEISSDPSGRSFIVRTPDSRTFYFWCSEKSKLLGVELLGKMKDLLKRKPSIAELSGISKSRLDCFATQLRAYLVGSAESSMCASPCANSTSSCNSAVENSPISTKFPRSRNIGGQAGKGDSAVYQNILSPRSSSFKEAPPRMSPHRIAAREKIKRRGDSHQSFVDNSINDSTNNLDLSSTLDHNKVSEVVHSLAYPSSNFLESLGKLATPSNVSIAGRIPPLVSPLLSPYYCWCPAGISSIPSLGSLPQSSGSSIDSPCPSGASLLPNTLPATLLEPVQPLDISATMDFPPFLPDPLVRMSLPTSQQIPTFTPLMCDPIVHVPVIDVCSSGQGYLVSAGPAMSTSIPPLHPKLVNPLIPESDSVVKGARETLRLLISGSNQSNSGVSKTVAESASDLCGKYGISNLEVKNPNDAGGGFSDEEVPSFEPKQE